MKAGQLHDLWASPDNTRLTSKQFSFRLPVHIAAKIAALCEIYPQKNRTQIVADLLTTALDELEKNLPECAGERAEKSIEEHIAMETGEYEPLYYMGGVRARFQEVANRHYRELEIELGNEKPERLFTATVGTKEDFNKPKS
jgi:hypothetical protein